MNASDIEKFFSGETSTEELPRYNWMPIGDDKLLVVSPSKRKGKRFLKIFMPDLKVNNWSGKPYDYTCEIVNSGKANNGYMTDDWDYEEIDQKVLQWNFPKRKFLIFWMKYEGETK